MKLGINDGTGRVFTAQTVQERKGGRGGEGERERERERERETGKSNGSNVPKLSPIPLDLWSPTVQHVPVSAALEEFFRPLPPTPAAGLKRVSCEFEKKLSSLLISVDHLPSTMRNQRGILARSPQRFKPLL